MDNDAALTSSTASAKPTTLRESLDNVLAVMEDYERRGILKTDGFRITDPNGQMVFNIMNEAISRLWNKESRDFLDKVNAQKTTTNEQKYGQLVSESRVANSLPGMFSLIGDGEVVHLVFTPSQDEQHHRYLDVPAIRRNVDTILAEINEGWSISQAEDGAVFFTKAVDNAAAYIIRNGLEDGEKGIPANHITQIISYPDGCISWEKELREEKARLVEHGGVLPEAPPEALELPEGIPKEHRQLILQREAQRRERESMQKDMQMATHYPPGANNVRPLRRLEAIDLELTQTRLPVVVQGAELEDKTRVNCYLVIPATSQVAATMKDWGATLPDGKWRLRHDKTPPSSLPSQGMHP